MYNDLDSPPPRSQFLPDSYGRKYTRPWSPDPYDPLPSTIRQTFNPNQSGEAFQLLQGGQHSRRQDNGHQPQADYTADYPPLPEDHFPVLHSKRRREASEVSVEALDLADYARTLRTRQAEDPYPAFPFADSSLNSSTRETHNHAPKPVYSAHPPSSFPAALVARGGTRSSANTSSTSTHQTPRSNVTVPLPANHSTSTPQLARPSDPDDEIDISQFPAWSRGWYNGSGGRGDTGRRQGPQRNIDSLEAYELEAGLALPKPLLGESSKGSARSLNNRQDPVANVNFNSSSHRQPLSPFDPTYVHPQSYPRAGADWFDDGISYPSYSAPSYSNHDPLLGGSREGVVPWSHDPPEYGQPPLDPQVKENRMRMLEKAFGNPTDSKRASGGISKKGKEKERDDGLMRDDDGNLMVGTPDGKGGLATQGPKLRAAVRVLQVLLVVAVGAPVIYAAVAIKPNPAPPPAGKPPIYILYVLSPITLLLLLYLFVVRPCTVRRKFSSARQTPYTNPGMMVLPVAGGGGKAKGKKKSGPTPFPPGKKKKGKKGGPGMPGDLQVNLIVDPNAFGLPGGQDLSSSSEEDEDDLMFDDGGMPGAFYPKPPDSGKDNSERAKRKRKKQRRRTLMAALKLEDEWKFARSWIRKQAFLDALVCVLWGVAFGFVIAGQRCPTGGPQQGYGGWCTAYNASTAAACLLCLSFALTIFFGVKDLYASKLSPRTRM
ncbi:hypothetical protein H1R20_g7507, partial [Candolleomyces eurysporus]